MYKQLIWQKIISDYTLVYLFILGMFMTHKTLFITGGSSGIAKATVLQAVKTWYQVAFMARREKEGEQVIQEALEAGAKQGQVRYYQGDVTDFTQLEDIIDRVRQECWPITHLFCCAGTYMPGDLLTSTLQEWNDLRTLNVLHMVKTMQSVLPMMQESHKGSIVLMGSDQTFIAKKQSSIYGATKAAIGQLTKSTALDYAWYGIRVNCICPGTVETEQAMRNVQTLADESFQGDLEQAKEEISKNQMIDRRATPDEIANVVLFLLSEQSSFMTWSLVSADGGYTAS